MKSILHTFILLICLLALSSCSSRKPRFTIGVSQCSDDAWRSKLNEELKTGEYLNDSIHVVLKTANDDSRVQEQQINSLVESGVDLLIVSPNQSGPLSTAIASAYDRGIPVILCDRRVSSDKYTAFIGCDNYLIGRAMATYISEKLDEKGRVVEIRGLEGSSPAMERHRGFVDELKQHPGVELVASEGTDWKDSGATKAMNRILEKTQDFDYVFAHNDRLAEGAYKAARKKAPGRQYKYTGIDGLASGGGGLELVRDGVLDASFLYPTKGDEVLDLAMRILKGEKFERNNQLTTSIVTEDNVNLILMEALDGERQRHNLRILHGQVDKYLASYNSQKVILFGLAAFLIVLIGAIVLVYRNFITKKLLSEQLARSNDELKRLNKEVLDLTHSRMVFFTNISHELRTPLTLIADPVEMLLEDKSIRGRSHELLKMVRRNAASLQQLVTTILDFRKIQTGRMKLQLTRFNLAGKLSGWVSDYAPTAQRKKIHLEVDTEGFSAPETVCDEPKLARVIYNLLSNAMKYTQPGGTIRVSLSDAPGDSFRITVADNGSGIAAADLPNVFERFFQASGAASGTGIGLALVKSITELLHGSVSVESEQGKGAEFTVIIPLVQEGQEIADTADAAMEPVEAPQLYADDPADNANAGLQKLTGEGGEKPTLLVIDDNSDIRQYERSILSDRFLVMEAGDGRQGLELALREVPDMIICDIMMPVMDGLQFCKELRSHTATSHIPVIMLTAKSLDEQRIEGYNSGTDAYIVKPFSHKVLLARIENLMRQRNTLREFYQGDMSSATSIIPAAEEDSKLTDRDKEFSARLRAIIQKHIGDSDFSVELIGQEIGLSRVQLYRKVKALTGCSVVDVMRKARLTKAYRLLETTHAGISEIAYEVGFSSPSYFAKCFKEEFGKTPGEVHAQG